MEKPSEILTHKEGLIGVLAYLISQISQIWYTRGYK